MHGILTAKILEWWATRRPIVRYGIALVLLGWSAIDWFGYGKLSIWMLCTGIVLMVAAAVMKDYSD
jgi:hypothetical protein